MAFLDDWGKKITMAGQNTIQKTKEIADIAKINSLILEEEKIVNNNYYQIGKLYVSLHVSDYENVFEGMIQAVCVSEKKIKEYRQEIQKIKKVIRCEKCGTEVADNAAFCSFCGAEIVREKEESDDCIRCEGCGQLVQKDMRFCTSCGKLIKNITETIDMEYRNLQDENIEEKKCPNCGVLIEEELSFCTACGTKL